MEEQLNEFNNGYANAEALNPLLSEEELAKGDPETERRNAQIAQQHYADRVSDEKNAQQYKEMQNRPGKKKKKKVRIPKGLDPDIAKGFMKF